MSYELPDLILRNVLDSILIVDDKGAIIYVNAAAEKLFNKKSGELVGQSFGYPIQVDEVQEIEIFMNKSAVTAQMLATSIQWKNKSLHVLSLRDITELKRISAELEKQKQKLQNSNRELEQYASLASHDLKEPARKIMLYSERLLHHPAVAASTDLSNPVMIIRNCAQRMQMLIKGIAEYSRSADPVQHFIDIDCNEVLQDVLNDLELPIRESKATIVREKLPNITGVKIQIHQLFQNLILNAIKYARKEVPPQITISCQDLDDRVQVKISDNGIGLDNSHAEKIFQPFQRLHPSHNSGTGIGLTICKKIVHAHGGNIWVNAGKKCGCEFVFTLSKEPDHV